MCVWRLGRVVASGLNASKLYVAAQGSLEKKRLPDAMWLFGAAAHSLAEGADTNPTLLSRL